MIREEIIAQVERMRLIRENVEKRLTKLSGVVGVGIGVRFVGGRQTDELCWVVTVDHKRSERDLSPSEVVPRNVAEYPTDVRPIIVVKPPEPKVGENGDDTPGKFRPLIGGIAIQAEAMQLSGTLGCMAQMTTGSRDVVLLSNQHVLAPFGSIGARVSQPYPISKEPNYVGAVTAAQISNIGLFPPYGVDCGIAKLDDGIGWMGRPHYDSVPTHT